MTILRIALKRHFAGGLAAFAICHLIGCSSRQHADGPPAATTVTTEAIGGEVVELVGTFTSPWSESRQFQNVRGSCSCTSASMSPMELHPGQKGIVTVKFDSRGKPGGPHTLEFLATDVRGKADKLPIQFQVDVRRPIFFDSQSVDFGELDPEQPASRSMRLYSEAPLEASRVRIEGLPDKVAFQFHASDQSPKPENHFAYDVKISAPSNSILETVRCTPAVIVRDFQKRDRRFPFNFAATIRPPLSIEPAKAFMGAFNRKEQTLKFDILSKQSVESLSVRGPDWLKIDDHFDPMQKSLELRILRVPEGAPPLAGTFQLTLEARTADQPTTIVSIPVMYVLVE